MKLKENNRNRGVVRRNFYTPLSNFYKNKFKKTHIQKLKLIWIYMNILVSS